MVKAFGRLIQVIKNGEAYGTAISVMVDGCPADLESMQTDVQLEMNCHKPGQSKIATDRSEAVQVFQYPISSMDRLRVLFNNNK